MELNLKWHLVVIEILTGVVLFAATVTSKVYLTRLEGDVYQ